MYLYYRFSSTGNVWSYATLHAPWYARSGHTTVLFQDKIWVIGGATDSVLWRDVWYSSDGTNWNRAISNAAWTGRALHSSVVYDNKIWVLGGYTKECTSCAPTRLNEVWYSSNGVSWYNMGNAEWSARQLSSSVVFQSEIWAMGGDSNSGVLNDIWKLSPNVILSQAPTPRPTAAPTLVPTPAPTPTAYVTVSYSQCAPYTATYTDDARQDYVTCEIVICPGQTMTSSLCDIYRKDTYIRLFQNSTEVAMSDNNCGPASASKLSYKPPALTQCTTFSLRQGCYGYTYCSGTTQVFTLLLTFLSQYFTF
jgi:N-acetylneuraminic acid mutarotase